MRKEILLQDPPQSHSFNVISSPTFHQLSAKSTTAKEEEQRLQQHPRAALPGNPAQGLLSFLHAGRMDKLWCQTVRLLFFPFSVALRKFLIAAFCVSCHVRFNELIPLLAVQLSPNISRQQQGISQNCI